MISWLPSIAATWVAGLYVLALISRGHCQKRCVDNQQSNTSIDCVHFNFTCGNDKVTIKWSDADYSCHSVDIGYDCYYNNSRTPGDHGGYYTAGDLEYSITNGGHCVYYACAETHGAYRPLSNGTVTCTATTTEMASSTIASPSSSAPFSSTGTTSSQPLTSSQYTLSSNDYSTTVIYTPSSVTVDSSSSSLNNEYTLSTIFSTPSSDQMDVSSSTNEYYTTSFHLMPSSSFTATSLSENIIIAIIVTVGVLGATIAIVIVVGLWIKLTRRSKKKLRQDLIFHDKIEFGTLLFLEIKSKSLVTLTEPLETDEQLGSIPIKIHGQVNEDNPPSYCEIEDGFLKCTSTVTEFVIRETVPDQKLASLEHSDENCVLRFSEEKVLTQIDDSGSVNSYIDTATPLQQQQQHYSTALLETKKGTASFSGSSVSSISEMCVDPDTSKFVSDAEDCYPHSPAMIERDDGYLATT